MALGQRRMRQAAARAALEALVPAAATAAALAGDELESLAVSGASGGGVKPLSSESLFDLASLTKPVCATLALALDAAGELPLAASLGEIWGPTAGSRAATKLEDLLRHRARLPVWAPLYEVCAARADAAGWLLSSSPVEPKAPSYGDLDYVLWGLTAERALGRPLDRLLRAWVTDPLDLAGPRFAPHPESAVACGLDTDREVELAATLGLEIAPLGPPPRGVAQDGNARFLGGVSAHAGLFSSAGDLLALLAEWVAPGALFDRERRDRALSAKEGFALGWWPASSWLRPETAGKRVLHHIGFTGGGLWLEPATGRRLVLLAHRRSLDVDLRSFRRELYDSF